MQKVEKSKFSNMKKNCAGLRDVYTYMVSDLPHSETAKLLYDS